MGPKIGGVRPKGIVLLRLPGLQLGRIEELFPGDSDVRRGPEDICHRGSIVGSWEGGTGANSGSR